MQAYYTVFDRDTKTVGFATATCNRTCANFTTCGECTASPSCVFCPADQSCRARPESLLGVCPTATHFVDGRCSLPEVTTSTCDTTEAECGICQLSGTNLDSITGLLVTGTAINNFFSTSSSLTFNIPPQACALAVGSSYTVLMTALSTTLSDTPLTVSVIWLNTTAFRGPQGPQGVQGSQGPAGLPGTADSM